MFGGLGILIGIQNKKFFLMPLSIRLHDGLQFQEAWKWTSGSAMTHIVQMVEDSLDDVKTFGRSLLLLKVDHNSA